MSTYIVEGRRFEDRLQATTLAARLAREADRSVDVKVETTDILRRKHRSWMCRMHPPGMLRTLIKQPPIPHVRSAAV